jgi:hypothetical protein
MNRLLTRDPASGAELVVTRLWCPTSGVVVEGEFALGWIGKLSPDQLEYVGLLLSCRNNMQRLANELGVSYNTARARLDEIVVAIGGPPEDEETRPVHPVANEANRLRILEALAAGEITHDDAVNGLRRSRGESGGSG